MAQSWWILLLAGRSNFKTTPDVGCSKIITLTVNTIVYVSLFQCCNRHRQLHGYLSFNSCHLNPAASTDKLSYKWARNKASLNSAIYSRCFSLNGVSIIDFLLGVFIEKPCLNCRAPLPPFWNFKYGSRELLYSNKFHKRSVAWYVL